MSSIPWHENDTYWASVYDFFFSDKAFSQAAQNVPLLIQLTGHSTGDVLDLGCGPGRFAVPLAKAGFKVTGLDRTRMLLDRAKEYAAAQGVHVEWVQDDMRQFMRPDTYDLVISMFTSFGYFEDIHENRAVLENVFRSLKPGGVLLMDIMGKEILAKKMQPTGVDTLPNGDLLIERPKIVDDWQKVENEITTITHGEIRHFPVRLWIFSGRELKMLLASAGFKKIKLFGSLDGKPYGHDATRLIAVAEK
jgi:2-polyprenyl-3-methyl-5-hydroxy-6-metoxy-1,4-benzoquinol methylase